MKSRFLRVLILVIPFSFFMGAYWGFRTIQKQQERPPSLGEIRLLAQKGFLPTDVQDWIYDKHKIKVHVTEIESDIELLDAIQTQSRDFDVIQVPSYFSKHLIYEEVYQPLKKDLLTALKNISVDFMNLEYDTENKYLLPISWGVNGMVYNKKNVTQPEYSIKAIMNEKAYKNKIALLPSSVEIFTTTKLLFPIIEGWVRSEEMDPIVRTLKKIKPLFAKDLKRVKSSLRNGSLLYSQLSNGYSAALVDQAGRFEFFVPDEKSNLWMHLIGVSKHSFQADLAHDFVNLLMKPRTAEIHVEKTLQATTIRNLDNSSIHPMRKSSFLRKIHLSKISIPTEHVALQPVWAKSLEKALPQFHGKNSESTGDH